MLQAQQALKVLAFVVPKDAGANGVVGAIPFDDFEVDENWHDLLEQMIVRYYVEMRYTIIPDPVEMLRRWGAGGTIRLLSSSQLYSAFVAKEANLERLKENKITQTVDIKEVRKMRHGVYRVSFDLYTRGADGMRRRGPIIVSLVYRYSNRYRFFSSGFSNPLGMYFVSLDRSMN